MIKDNLKEGKRTVPVAITLVIIISAICLLSGCNNSNSVHQEQSIGNGMQEENNNIDPMISKLVSGQIFYGQAIDDTSNKSWDYTFCITEFNSMNGDFAGKVEWPGLMAVHAIKGNINGNSFTYEETDYIKKGTAFLGVKYAMELQGEHFTGTWYDEKHHQQGSVSLYADKRLISDVETDTYNGPEVETTANAANKYDTLAYEYGRSGYNNPLTVYKISNDLSPDEKSHKILCVFAIHGFEDAFYRDGQVLVDIAHDVGRYFMNNQEELKNYELLIVPCANPDGVKQGWTCNGPGRCQLSEGIDINMDFDYEFKVRTNNRNKTGDKPFASPEARALRDLVIEEAPDIIIDFHGWINCATGDKEIADIFCKHLRLAYEPKEKAIYRGFFSGWAAKYAQAVLIEYPDPITGQGACDLKSDQKYEFSQEKLDELQYTVKTVESIKEIIARQL